MKPRKPRPKKCATCLEIFQPERPFQQCCLKYGLKCTIKKAQKDRERKKKRDLAKRRKEGRTRTEWLDAAQIACNKYIRKRDENMPCIVCGTFHEAKYSAGHFFTRAARSDLRYNQNNIFKQCFHTNNFTSVDTAEKFRANVIGRIGQEEFDKLQVVGRSDWTIQEIQEIEQHYKSLLKGMK